MATPVCSLPLSALRHSFLLRSLTPLRCSLSSTLSPLSLLSSLSPSSLSPSSRSPFSRSSSSSSSLSSLSSLSSPLSCVSSAGRTFSSLSLQDGICGSDEKSVIRASERLKRLMYRAKQRGWVELDLLLGAYCDENVPSMSTEEVEELEKILAAENVVLFDCLVGKDWKRAPAPPEFGHLSQWRKLSAFVEARLPPPHSAGPQTETRGDLSAD
ncbi:TPR repeat region protein [Toxoplasma gondii RUB]|uniref:TPR repeat region protein n=1 Tax=Toxoplasma gondii RUB TaxID=935652 RepID=A0A086M868_TOXGO|nr:TPR repeat region protein [Toxoplasma gondii RUB]